MPAEPLALAVLLVCALSWASFDFLRKALLDAIAPVPLVALIAILQTPLFAVWTAASGAGAPEPGYVLPAAISVLLNLLSNVLFVVAIKVSPLSVTVPLLSLTPVFTTLLAIPMLGEVPGPFQWAGITLVVLGTLALHIRPGRAKRAAAAATSAGARPAPADPAAESWTEATARPADLVHAVRHERGSVLMVAVALMWSIATPLDKLAIERSSSPFHGLVLSAGVALGLAVWLAARGELATLAGARRRPVLLAAALAASAIALATQLIAIRLVLVAIVETVKRGLGNVAAVAVGAGLFGERVSAWQWAAVALMAGGVGLILIP